MEITGNLEVREISPRVINGWSDVRFEDDETTAADFFEAVRQAIFERANAVLTGNSVYKNNGSLRPSSSVDFSNIEKLAEYPITQNTLSYEIFEIIEKAIYEISPYFLCGIDDSSSEIIGYRYRKNLDDFPFVLEEGNFGINDDIAFFKRPNTMQTWSEMKSCGYAYRLMNAINAMTSMENIGVLKVRNSISGGPIGIFGIPMYDFESFDDLIEKTKRRYLEFRDFYINGQPISPGTISGVKYKSGYCGIRIITTPNTDNIIYQYNATAYFCLTYYPIYEISLAIHPGSGTGADCLLRSVFVSFDTYNDFQNTSVVKDSYVENIEFLSLRNNYPLFCPHDRLIYVPEPMLDIIPSFSPSRIPNDPRIYKVSESFQYGQRFRFNQYYDFGIPGGFRFRKDT